MGKKKGAECINFNEEDPTEVIEELTEGTLADIVIDAVGVDAERPIAGPAEKKSRQFTEEIQMFAMSKSCC